MSSVVPKMKGEESPDVSKRNRERGAWHIVVWKIKILQQISCTPKGKQIGLDDLNLLGLHRDCSPNAYGSSHDKLEIGWGDSPEPLNIEQKSKLCSRPITCKKRLEAKESPKSRCRNIRPSFRPPSKPPIDVAKYVAEVKELSKKILSEIESDKNSSLSDGKENNCSSTESPISEVLDPFNGDDLTNECLIACSQSLENKLANNKSLNQKEKTRKSFGSVSSSKQDSGETKQQNDHGTSNSDSAFEKILQSFISEEDDWLSQVAFSTEDIITPRKNGFMKTKSENQLTSPDKKYEKGIPPSRRSGGLINSFRRTYSSDMVGSNDYSKTNPCYIKGRTSTKRSSLTNEKPQRNGYR